MRNRNMSDIKNVNIQSYHEGVFNTGHFIDPFIPLSLRTYIVFKVLA